MFHRWRFWDCTSERQVLLFGKRCGSLYKRIQESHQYIAVIFLDSWKNNLSTQSLWVTCQKIRPKKVTSSFMPARDWMLRWNWKAQFVRQMFSCDYGLFSQSRKSVIFCDPVTLMRLSDSMFLWVHIFWCKRQRKLIFEYLETRRWQNFIGPKTFAYISIY